MKVYTKTGDRGTTSLIGGKRVEKSDARIEAYGTIDELNSFLGLLRDQKVCEDTKELLIRVQGMLMVGSAILANGCEGAEISIPKIREEEISVLEQKIDEYNESLPPMRAFVLPGGHQAVSFCHIARTVCRRAERRATELLGEIPDSELVVKYLNRLSDYLFVLSRKISADLMVNEIEWEYKI